jgi:hypothetical protein
MITGRPSRSIKDTQDRTAADSTMVEKRRSNAAVIVNSNLLANEFEKARARSLGLRCSALTLFGEVMIANDHVRRIYGHPRAFPEDENGQPGA